MKKLRFLFIFLFMFMFIGIVKADTAPEGFTLDEITLNCAGNSATQDCVYTDTSGKNVFCLQQAYNVYSGISYGSPTKINNTGIACGILSAIKNGYISEPTSDGETLYYTNYDGNHTPGRIQHELWQYENNTQTCNSISSLSDIITKTTNLPAGTINISNASELDKQGDYYVASMDINYSNLTGNKYSITRTDNNLIVSESADGGNVTESSATKLYIRIPISSISEGSNSYNVTLSGNYIASTTRILEPFIYYYGPKNSPDNTQAMGIPGIKRTTTSTPDSVEKSQPFSISITPKLILKKVDPNGQLLRGSVLKVKKDGVNFGEYTLRNGIMTIEDNVTFGTYCVYEITAPDGYIINDNLTGTTAAAENCVEISATNPTGTIVFENEPTIVRFKKVWYDEVNKEYMNVSDAEFKIVDASGATVKDSTGKEIVWTTDGSTYEVKGLKVGKYSVIETKVPKGYTKVKNIDFEIKDDGSVVSEALESKLNIMDKNELTIVIKEEQTVTKFSKQDATTGKELPGATLQILDSNKKPILDKDGKELYKWVSTNKPHIIEGLPAGKYYLKETIAPAGYQLSTEMVSFEVKEDGTVTQVVMKNKPEEVPDVPNTGKSNMSMLMLGGSLVLVASLGLLIYTIVRRKKANV